MLVGVILIGEYVDTRSRRKSSNVNEPKYDPDTDAILIPGAPYVNPQKFIQGIDLAQVPQIIIHEMGHAVIKGNNAQLTTDSHPVTGTDNFAKAINEGLSDVLAALHSETFAAGDWIVGDDYFSDPNLTINGVGDK